MKGSTQTNKHLVPILLIEGSIVHIGADILQHAAKLTRPEEGETHCPPKDISVGTVS